MSKMFLFCDNLYHIIKIIVYKIFFKFKKKYKIHFVHRVYKDNFNTITSFLIIKNKEIN